MGSILSPEIGVKPDRFRTARPCNLRRWQSACEEHCMIRKLKSGEYRLYSRKKDAKSGKAKNLGTFKTRAAAEKHERAVQFFKRA